jgi:hypothetical protein
MMMLMMMMAAMIVLVRCEERKPVVARKVDRDEQDNNTEGSKR